MGDGINDVFFMKVVDVGIFVDIVVDIVKEIVDVILFDKDFMVFEKGFVEGCKVYVNMIKYIKMIVSFNFGNILFLLVFGIFLLFLLMVLVYLIILNLVYDLFCIVLFFDKVDKDFLRNLYIWEVRFIIRFMIWMGFIFFVFDILIFILFYFIIVFMIIG